MCPVRGNSKANHHLTLCRSWLYTSDDDRRSINARVMRAEKQAACFTLRTMIHSNLHTSRRYSLFPSFRHNWVSLLLLRHALRCANMLRSFASIALIVTASIFVFSNEVECKSSASGHYSSQRTRPGGSTGGSQQANVLPWSSSWLPSDSGNWQENGM